MYALLCDDQMVVRKSHQLSKRFRVLALLPFSLAPYRAVLAGWQLYLVAGLTSCVADIGTDLCTLLAHAGDAVGDVQMSLKPSAYNGLVNPMAAAQLAGIPTPSIVALRKRSCRLPWPPAYCFRC